MKKLGKTIEFYAGEVDGAPVIVIKEHGPHRGHPKTRTIGADVPPSAAYNATREADLRAGR